MIKKYTFLRHCLWGLGLATTFCGYVQAQNNASASVDSIRLNQIGFYPNAPKVAIVLTDKAQPFVIQTAEKQQAFAGKLQPSAKPDLSGRTIYIADFSTLKQPGKYVLSVPGTGYSYQFAIAANVHHDVAAGAVKGFYYQRVSIALPEKYAGQWHRAAGHPDNEVLVHPSAASDKRPAGTVISSPRGWYDAGDYNKYIVNSGISMGTLLSICEDFPAYTKTVKLNIPESSNQVPDILDEILWNLRWMLTMQDPNDGGVYHKLTNAKFDAMIMPDQAHEPRYVVQKSTAATLDFAAVMAQANRVLKTYNRQLPGLADSCLNAAHKAWQWAEANPKLLYDQTAMNATFKPEVSTGTYGDRDVADEWAWAAAELYITTRNDSYLKHVILGDEARLSIPSWAQVRMMGYYSLLRNRRNLTPAGAAAIPALTQKMLAFADSLVSPTALPAYQTVMGRSPRDFNWGSSSNAANQGMALVQAYLLKNDPRYINGALSNLDYLLGRNGTGYSFLTGFGSKPVMHPHHRPSVADGIVPPVPGLLSGGPNPGQQDGIKLPSRVPNQAYIDDDRAYAVNEIAINWNAPLAYLVNAIEALQNQAGYSAKSNSNHLQHPVKFGILLKKAYMPKSLLVFLITGWLTILSLRLVASPQMPDYIVYQKDTIATYNLLLEHYLQRQKPDESGKLFGLSFREGTSFNCWRGYQAIYKIDNDSLFLTDIINCGERWGGKINKTASVEKMKAIFGDKLVNNRVHIDWFSNDISFPLSNKVVRWDGVFYKIYEKEKVISIAKGKVINIADVENYVDNPKAIDRRNKDKINEVLFTKLKKVKWKNTDDCDCSEGYWVTIDANGRVSKVKMEQYLADEKIAEEWQDEETKYCIKTVFNAFKKLKFDVIKDKGKPFAEDIYLKIWIEDGKIENWTH